MLLSKYDDPAYPTLCKEDVLYVLVDPKKVSPDDLQRLRDIGFIPTHEIGVPCFMSYRYGSS